MLPAALAITKAQARNFMVRALGLTTPFPDVAGALAHHAYIQLDPINVCGRMHDLILRNRVNGYREGDLLRFLYGSNHGSGIPRPEERRAFEHYVSVLTALPLDAWPFLVESMRERARRTTGWAGKLAKDEEAIARRILRLMEKQGPLSSDDIEHDERSLTAWNSNARLVKVVLEKLFLHGRVLITTRRGFRRVYDLPERVLPAALLAESLPDAHEIKRWRTLTKLRQRRLVRLNRDELRLVADHIQPVRIDQRALVYCLRSDAALLETVTHESRSKDAPAIRLLAPLDPVIYDRELTRRVWDFDYTWEVYTPPAKRVRGYYALPVLRGLEIVGHVDPKADRERRRLVIVSRRMKRGVAAAGAVAELAKFLELR